MKNVCLKFCIYVKTIAVNFALRNLEVKLVALNLDLILIKVTDGVEWEMQH